MSRRTIFSRPLASVSSGYTSLGHGRSATPLFTNRTYNHSLTNRGAVAVIVIRSYRPTVRRNLLAAGVACALVIIGVAGIVGAILLPNSRVHAVKVDATVVASHAGCGGYDGARLAFRWHGHLVQSRTALLTCAEHPVGDHVAVYVASNDPTRVELQATAIIDPGTVDPFAVFGPNDLNGLIGFLGVATVLGGAMLYFLECRPRTPSRERPAEAKHPAGLGSDA